MTNVFEIGISRFLELLVLPGKNQEILWIIFPLIIVTTIMFFYFQKYKDEELGWNSAVANSLVAIFVSVSLLRYIYSLTSPGVIENFTIYLPKSIFALLLFFWGFFLLIINFEHLLPKKFAYFMSSPISLNIVAYVFILFVYSELPFDLITFVDLIMLLVILRIIASLVQKPVQKLFLYLETLKEKEKIEDVKIEKNKIKKNKIEIKNKEEKIKKKIKKEEKLIKKVKKEVNKSYKVK